MYQIFLFAGLCVLLGFLCKLYIFKDGAKVSGIRGPSFLELVLHIFRNRAHLEDAVKILSSLHKKYGATFLIHIKPFSPIVVTSDHNHFGNILASKEHLNKSFPYDLFQNFFGESLVLVKNIDVWKSDRKILNEAFGHDSFKVFLEHLDQKLHVLEDTILEKISSPTIDIQDIFHKFILQTTIESIKDPLIGWNPERTHEFKRATNVYFDNAVKKILFMAFNMDRFFKMTSTYQTLESAAKIIRQYGYDMVDAHLKTKHKEADTSNLIYRMHAAGIPYERIVDHTLMFIESAYDTVATTLGYTIFEIAKHPDIQRRICAEVNEIIGNKANATISTADLLQMKYVGCVIKEGLRIHPPLSYVMRTVHKQVVDDKVIIPPGTSIVFNIDVLHKTETNFKDPMVFNPDRFNAENKPNLVPNSWTPFSLGIRNCIGKPLGMQKMKLILARMVRRFEFSPVVPEHTLDIRAAFLNRSVNGALVVVKERQLNT